MPKTIKVVLNETEHTITELRSRDNAAWRKKLEQPFADLAALLEGAPEVEITNLADLAGVVRSASGMLLRSIDTVKDLVLAYAPGLSGALDDAYDSEILEAFTAVLGLAYPFGQLVQRIKSLGTNVRQM